MAYDINVGFEEVRELDFGAIGAAYAALGSPMSEWTRIIDFYNSTDVDIYVTDDVTKDKRRIASGSGQVLDLNANSVGNDALMINKGRQFYIKQVNAAPTTGTFWLQSVYATARP